MSFAKLERLTRCLRPYAPVLLLLLLACTSSGPGGRPATVDTDLKPPVAESWSAEDEQAVEDLEAAFAARSEAAGGTVEAMALDTAAVPAPASERPASHPRLQHRPG